MISKTLYKGSRAPAISRVFTSCSSIQRINLHSTAPRGKGVKETLSDVNMKVGKAAAEGIEKTEEKSQKVSENLRQAEEKVKNVLHQTGKKAGEKAEEQADKAKKAAKDMQE